MYVNKTYNSRGGSLSGSEWYWLLIVRPPLCGIDSLLNTGTPGSPLRDIVTQSNLSIPPSDGMLKESMGPS